VSTQHGLTISFVGSTPCGFSGRTKRFIPFLLAAAAAVIVVAAVVIVMMVRMSLVAIMVAVVVTVVVVMMIVGRAVSIRIGGNVSRGMIGMGDTVVHGFQCQMT